VRREINNDIHRKKRRLNTQGNEEVTREGEKGRVDY
jgi:hypothetical protein